LIRSAGGLGLALAAVALLAACAREPIETRARFMAMGTLVEVTVFDFPREEAQAAILDVESLFRDLQQRWDPWGDGELARLNADLAAGQAVEPSPELGALLARAAELDRLSGGRFEPSIGGLIRLWGFNAEDNVPSAPPPPAEIAAALAQVTPLPEVIGEDGRLRGADGMAIDLGGFAKGEAVDLAIALLRERGVRDAIVNAGGDLRAIGRHGDRDWRIGVRAPRGEGILAAIEISGDESVFTSGDYERYFVLDGRRYHHILDPADGYPTRDTASVTVLGIEAAAADAAATALFVAGPEDWPAVAAALGVDRVMLVDAEGVIHLTPAMADRVHLPGADDREIRVVALP
jgi:thiamine biosynthesis lipoprotein